MKEGNQNTRRQEIRQNEYDLEQAIRFNAVLAHHHAERIIRLVSRNSTAAEYSFLLHNANRVRSQAATDEQGNIISISTNPSQYREIARSLGDDMSRIKGEDPSKVQSVFNMLTEKMALNCRGIDRLSAMTSKPDWTPGREAIRTMDYLREIEPEIWEDV